MPDPGDRQASRAYEAGEHPLQIAHRQTQAVVREMLDEHKPWLDNCAFCLGVKGGVPGNENVIKGVIVCDYCTALMMKVGIK